jgi:hypothetical protein
MHIQVYVNGHDWLERKLVANKISCTTHDNVFFRIGDWKRAQKLTDCFTGLDWKIKLLIYLAERQRSHRDRIYQQEETTGWKACGVAYFPALIVEACL